MEGSGVGEGLECRKETELNGSQKAVELPIPPCCRKAMSALPEAEAKLHATVVSGWFSGNRCRSDKNHKPLYYNNPMWPGFPSYTKTACLSSPPDLRPSLFPASGDTAAGSSSLRRHLQDLYRRRRWTQKPSTFGLPLKDSPHFSKQSSTTTMELAPSIDALSTAAIELSISKQKHISRHRKSMADVKSPSSDPTKCANSNSLTSSDLTAFFLNSIVDFTYQYFYNNQ